MTNLGRLTRVALRSEWSTEDGDFTPWLAREENIKLLGETLGMDLEVEAEEKRVGRFSADILAKNLYDGDAWVVIENQLERTDHRHLGQILTYAAGLEAKTCIWVAAEFREEHRAAIDWLNEITGEDHQFFALEIELWQIGDSMAAPKFNVVAQPNGWKREVVKRTQKASSGPVGLLQYEYWQQLSDSMAGHRIFKQRKPQAASWLSFPIGRSGLNLATIMGVKRGRASVELCMDDQYADSYFQQLLKHREAVEAETKRTFDWLPLEHGKRCFDPNYRGCS